jgi:hypothetical protein
VLRLTKKKKDVVNTESKAIITKIGKAYQKFKRLSWRNSGDRKLLISAMQCLHVGNTHLIKFHLIFSVD